MKRTMFPNTFFKNNRDKLAKALKDNDVVVFYSAKEYLRNGDQYYDYRQSSNMIYFSSIEQPDTTLIVGKSIQKIFVRRKDELKELWQGHILTIEQVNEISGIEDIAYEDEVEDYLQVLSQKGYNILEQGDDTINTIVAGLRVVKDKYEIEALKKAVDITKQTFLKIKNELKPNMMEYELEGIMIGEFIRKGAKGHSFSPIVASGSNALCLHYGDNNSLLRDGDLVLLDFGADYDNYTADLSMTIPINGRFNTRQKEIYDKVLEIHNKIKFKMRVGMSINRLNSLTVELIKQACIDLSLLTKEDLDKDEFAYKKYYPHGVTHHIGLDAHDVGDKNEGFKPNMVLTCEPGLYIKEENIGIRIETDVLITDDQPIDLFSLV